MTNTLQQESSIGSDSYDLDDDIDFVIDQSVSGVEPQDPFDLIESGMLYIRTKAGKLMALTPETMKPAQLRAYRYIKEEYLAGRKVQVRWLKYRQGGFSTLAELIVFAVTVCNDYYNSLVLSNVEDTANWIHSMDKTFQREMERRGTARYTLKKSNSREIIWEGSGSSIRIGSAKAKNVGITETRNCLHASEVAYYEGWPITWANINPSIHDLPGNIIILESTANGAGGPFHQDWLAGERGEGGFKNFFFAWHEDLDYYLDPPADFEMTPEEATLAERFDWTPGQVY